MDELKIVFEEVSVDELCGGGRDFVEGVIDGLTIVALCAALT